MNLAITIWAVLAAWRWGNWGRFHQYHATMLYMGTMNLLYLFLTSRYPLWRIQSELGIPSTIIIVLYTFIVFPCSVLLYLSHYPESTTKQILHIIKWVVIYFGVEWVGGLFGRITYEHGWHLGWSLLFVLTMFPMLRLHYKKPMLTYMLSMIIIVFLLYFFNVP